MNFLRKIVHILKKLNPWKRNLWIRTSKTWNELNRECSGYDSEDIIGKVVESTFQVVHGKYAYERDSVLFSHVEYSWPLAFYLMKSLSQDSKLSVLDFGGSLGSSYRQNRNLIGNDYTIRWNIVEQDSFYTIGKEKFQTNELVFYSDVESCLKGQDINFVLVSSVLEYLENPSVMLEKLLSIHSRYVVLDRLPVSNVHRVFLTKQIVPEGIYKAQYPCWIFSSSFLQDAVRKFGYKIVFEGKSFVPNPINFGKGVSSEAMVFVLEKI